MMRAPNWDVALRRWADRMIGLPYVWGDTDCVHLALGALHVMYPDQLTLPAFPTKHGALAAAAQQPLLLEQTLGAFGATPFGLGFATMGDLVLAREPITTEEGALLVCLGAQCLTADPVHGVVTVPTSALPLAMAAWRFPHG